MGGAMWRSCRAAQRGSRFRREVGHQAVDVVGTSRSWRGAGSRPTCGNSVTLPARCLTPGRVIVGPGLFGPPDEVHSVADGEQHVLDTRIRGHVVVECADCTRRLLVVVL